MQSNYFKSKPKNNNLRRLIESFASQRKVLFRESGPSKIKYNNNNRELFERNDKTKNILQFSKICPDIQDNFTSSKCCISIFSGNK